MGEDKAKALYHVDVVEGIPGTVLPHIEMNERRTAAIDNSVVIPQNIVEVIEGAGERSFPLTPDGIARMRAGNTVRGGKASVTVGYMDAADKEKVPYSHNAYADPEEAGMALHWPEGSKIATLVRAVTPEAPAQAPTRGPRPEAPRAPAQKVKFIGPGFSFSASYAHVAVDDIYLVLVRDTDVMDAEPEAQQLSIVWQGVRYVCLPGPRFKLAPDDKLAFAVYLIEQSVPEPEAKS